MVFNVYQEGWQDFPNEVWNSQNAGVEITQSWHALINAQQISN